MSPSASHLPNTRMATSASTGSRGKRKLGDEPLLPAGAASHIEIVVGAELNVPASEFSEEPNMYYVGVVQRTSGGVKANKSTTQAIMTGK